jgi:hypothetical protein
LRSRSWRAIVWAASKLVRKIVSSKLRAPTNPPVFTSTVVSASVWSITRYPPDFSSTLRASARTMSSSTLNRSKIGRSPV